MFYCVFLIVARRQLLSHHDYDEAATQYQLLVQKKAADGITSEVLGIQKKLKVWVLLENVF